MTSEATVTDRHVTQLGHIIPILSKCCMISGQA